MAWLVWAAAPALQLLVLPLRLALVLRPAWRLAAWGTSSSSDARISDTPRTDWAAMAFPAVDL
jgi:hypothetical protein